MPSSLAAESVGSNSGQTAMAKGRSRAGLTSDGRKGLLRWAEWSRA